MANSVTSFPFSLTVRKIILRIIILSSLSSFLRNIITGVRFFLAHENTVGIFYVSVSLFPASVLLHHVLILWPRKQWSVRSDFIYSTIEFVLATGYLVTTIILTFDITGSLIAGFLCISLGASFFLTVWGLCASRHKRFRSTYDFMTNHDGTAINPGTLRTGWLSLVIGENICRRRFGSDGLFVRGLRAAISILCLLGMIMIGYLVLVVQPSQQQGYFRKMQSNFLHDMEYPKDNVTVIVDLYTGVGTSKFTSDDVDLDVTWQPASQHVLCDNNYLSFTCNVPSPFSDSSPETLVVKINYTRALQHLSTPSLRSGLYLTFLTGTQEYDGLGILPIQLYPGFHLFGTTSYSFIEIYAKSIDLTFGIPQFDRHLVANVQALVPDPEFSASEADTNRTATLRLTYQGGSHSVQRQYGLQREQASNSVLNGFATFGGIWTFVNGVFATLFGCKLMLVLFDIKPLSIYGLVHLFQRRRSLVDSGYTLSAEEQRQIIAVLREHLLDNHNDKGELGRGDAQDETQGDGGSMHPAEEQGRDNDVSRERLLDHRNSDLGRDQDLELRSLRDTAHQ